MKVRLWEEFQDGNAVQKLHGDTWVLVASGFNREAVYRLAPKEGLE